MNILKTQRLSLRQFNTSDAPFILQLLNSPSWIKFIGDRGVSTLEDAQNYLLKGPVDSYLKFSFGLWLVSLKDETPIGMCGLLQRESFDAIDIGFALLPEYEKKGFAFEAANATLIYAKEKLSVKKVVDICLPTNTQSIQLLEKLGMCFEKKIEFGAEELMLYTSN